MQPVRDEGGGDDDQAVDRVCRPLTPPKVGDLLKEGLTIGADTLAEFGGGTVEFIEVF